MTEPPNKQASDALPEEAYHSRFGNPTTLHPDVDPIHGDNLTIDAYFAYLVRQQTIKPGSESDPVGADSTSFSIVMTDLPVVMPGDIEEGLLLYTPYVTEPLQCVYEIEDASTFSVANAEASDIVVKEHHATPPPSQASAEDISVSTSEVEKSFNKIQEMTTFLQVSPSDPSTT